MRHAQSEQNRVVKEVQDKHGRQSTEFREFVKSQERDFSLIDAGLSDEGLQ